jgi:hypothetical protein
VSEAEDGAETTPVKVLAGMFAKYHQDTCYPDALPHECRIAARGMIAALTMAGFRIVKADS